MAAVLSVTAHQAEPRMLSPSTLVPSPAAGLPREGCVGRTLNALLQYVHGDEDADVVWGGMARDAAERKSFVSPRVRVIVVVPLCGCAPVFPGYGSLYATSCGCGCDCSCGCVSVPLWLLGVYVAVPGVSSVGLGTVVSRMTGMVLGCWVVWRAHGCVGTPDVCDRGSLFRPAYGGCRSDASLAATALDCAVNLPAQSWLTRRLLAWFSCWNVQSQTHARYTSHGPCWLGYNCSTAP